MWALQNTTRKLMMFLCVKNMRPNSFQCETVFAFFFDKVFKNNGVHFFFYKGILNCPSHWTNLFFGTIAKIFWGRISIFIAMLLREISLSWNSQNIIKYISEYDTQMILNGSFWQIYFWSPLFATFVSNMCPKFC